MDKESISRKYHDLTNFLIQHNLTISTMESITSGLIASLIMQINKYKKIWKTSKCKNNYKSRLSALILCSYIKSIR